MKRIFITGIAGLLGSDVAKHLLRKGYEVGGVDSLIGGYEDNIPIKNWHLLNILKTSELTEIMKDYDAVFHCSALPYEGVSVNSPCLVSKNIYAGTISTASAAIANNLKLFINFSSMARYGDIGPPFKETDIPKPVDPYGMAKYHAEQQLNLLSDIHGLKVYHVVPHNVIGRGQVYSDPYRNVAAIFANRLLQGKHVFIYGDGTQKRSFSHVDDCSKAVLELLENPKFPSGELFNIGPEGNEITIKELAFKIAHYAGVYPNLEFIPPRPREVKYSWVDVTKAKQLLNYKPNSSVDEIIKELIGYIKGRGTQPFKYHLNLEIIKENTPKTWTQKLI